MTGANQGIGAASAVALAQAGAAYLRLKVPDDDRLGGDPTESRRVRGKVKV